MSLSWLGFTVTHLWKHDLYPLCFSLSRSWSPVASTGRWIKLQVKCSLFSSSSNVSGPFAHGPALSPLSLSPCLLLLWCCSLHSSTLSVLLHVTMYQQERFPSDPARAKTALARAQWGGGGMSQRQLIVFWLNEELKVAYHFPSALQRCSHWIHL